MPRNTNRSWALKLLGRQPEQVSQMLHFPLHIDEGATEDTIVDYGNTGLFTSGIAIGGTTGSMWPTGGGFQPPGDQAHQDTREAVRAFFDLSTLEGVGGMLILFDLKLASTPSADITVFDHSQGNTTTGGYRIKISLGGGAQMQYRAAGGGLVGATAGALTPGQFNSVAHYLDMAATSKKNYAFLDGVADGSADLAGSPPVCDATRGLGLFCRHPTAAATDYQLGSASDGSVVKNLRFVRFEYNVLDHIEEIVLDAHHHGDERRLKSLRGR